jgi:uncharacterized protein involved in cysteine biosynthesis
MSAVAWTEIWGIGWLIGWFSGIAQWVAGIVFLSSVMFATLVLFPAVITIIVGFFLEDVVNAVEVRQYPDLPPARPQPVSEVLATTVKFAATVIALNVFFLPVYLILLFVPPLALALYYVLNGYLVSREYYELVALRRLAPGPARRLRRAHRGRVLLAGIVVVFIMTIPIVNFITPVLATAFMVHVFQNLPRRAEFTAPPAPGNGAPPEIA